VSSNLERLLFELTVDAGAVRSWQSSLARDGKFVVDRDTFAAMREHFSGDWVSNDESLQVIRRVWDEHGYLLDPHTSVAWEVAERLRSENPVLVVSTANWAKFGTDVFKALSGLPYASPLPPREAGLGGVALLHEVASMTGNVSPVPPGLSGLESLPERFATVVPAGRDAVEAAIDGWLSGPR
jgi:threonine synthase